MKKNKYIAYVGTYTHGSSIGIHLLDIEDGTAKMIERKVVPINNSSHVTRSHNGKFLYSIADEGVEAFRILEDGDLEPINETSIEGMRGCYLSTDAKDKYLFVAGHHDGKVTALCLNEDGSIGNITKGIFHKGLGSVAARNFLPHVSCVKMSPRQNYLCAVDEGIDQIKFYKFNHNTGEFKLDDILRNALESGPKKILFSSSGEYLYILHGITTYISVYRFSESADEVCLERIQRISMFENEKSSPGSASTSMKFSPDEKHIFVANAGDNSVTMLSVNEDGSLQFEFCLPISGEYPKDIELLPDGEHLISLNHESNQITIFKIDFQNKNMLMTAPPVHVDTPNCIYVSELY